MDIIAHICQITNAPFNCQIENPRTEPPFYKASIMLPQRLASKPSHKIPLLHLIVQYEAKASEVIRMSSSDEYVQLSSFPILI